jgi:NADPH-dependent glutamate synthase beta subunit-like oxidoreductase
VTVFDEAIEPGGMLRQGIPEYRLPRATLNAQIERIRRMGVEFRCGLKVGVDIDWNDLRDYDAVFVATGAHRDRPLDLPGEENAAVRPGLAFLKEVNRGSRPKLGRDVVVVGGGNTAIDCARTALRLGSKATVLYRRTRDEMPAIPEEVADAEREGVSFVFLAAPSSFVIDAGRLRGIDCMRMELGEPDASGRRRPVPRPNDRFGLPADTVLTATGEQIDIRSLPTSLGASGEIRVGWLGDVLAFRPVNDGPRSRILDRSRRTLFFAGGDVAGDERTVAHALGAGKRAAIGIDQALSGRLPMEALRFGRTGNASMTRWRRDDPVPRTNPVNDVVAFDLLNPAHYTHSRTHLDRHSRRVTPDFDEVNHGITFDVAIEEAKRCFNCGVCNDCELCLVFCADVAISRRPDGHGFDIDLEYCKGCGVCAEECPRGAIAMTREGV